MKDQNRPILLAHFNLVDGEIVKNILQEEGVGFLLSVNRGNDGLLLQNI